MNGSSLFYWGYVVNILFIYFIRFLHCLSDVEFRIFNTYLYCYFSGYVSEMRKRDWKKCWPFPVNEAEDQPPFPPLVVPKFKWWACERCRQAAAVEGTNRDVQIGFNYSNNNGGGSSSNCVNAVISSGIPQDPMPDNIIARRDIDLNIPIELSSDSDCDIENNAEIAQSRITGKSR